MTIAYNMDCMEAMRQMPDKCFDLAVVDPPYFSGPERRGYYGSGSSRIAAYDAGLDFVGFEIDKDYFEVQEDRFRRHTAQGNLFLQEAMSERAQEYGVKIGKA